MNDQEKKQVLRWWKSMNFSAEQLKIKGISPAPNAHKAQLKRCESADAVMLTEGFRSLWLALDDETTESTKAETIECWATIAAMLAYVKHDGKLTLAQASGMKGDGDKSIVSELRFAQLQNAKTPEDFMRRMRRIIQQIKGDVAVVQLADNIQQWFLEYGQLYPRKADKRISVKWAMEYYRAASGNNK